MSKDEKEQCFKCANLRLIKPFPDDGFLYCAAFAETFRIFGEDPVHAQRRSPTVERIMDLSLRCIKFDPRPFQQKHIIQDFEGAKELLALIATKS